MVWRPVARSSRPSTGGAIVRRGGPAIEDQTAPRDTSQPGAGVQVPHVADRGLERRRINLRRFRRDDVLSLLGKGLYVASMRPANGVALHLSSPLRHLTRLTYGTVSNEVRLVTTAGGSPILNGETGTSTYGCRHDGSDPTRVTSSPDDETQHDGPGWPTSVLFELRLWVLAVA